MENIRLGNPLANDKDVISAKLSYAHDFILSSKRVTKLIIRRGFLIIRRTKTKIINRQSLIKKHDVYIFDEVTNALDKNNENLIQNIIQELGKENIVIQISHLPNAIKKADKLFEINKSGKIKIINKLEN